MNQGNIVVKKAASRMQNQIPSGKQVEAWFDMLNLTGWEVENAPSDVACDTSLGGSDSKAAAVHRDGSDVDDHADDVKNGDGDVKDETQGEGKRKKGQGYPCRQPLRWAQP